eukprot:TRINITY_DN3986_c0_g1_i9.p3 TRINITY_DN3986_c0_g1~~TRINITY_DN3986_c0_g1_i9.p3  ORF type:complete len:135 (+),score=25.36 TRINITY_DN3986_c0_g1_i9:605-1009(+)
MVGGNSFNCVFAMVVGVKVNNKTLVGKRDDSIFEEYALSKITMEVRNMWLLIFMSVSYVLFTLAFCLLCFIGNCLEPSFFSVTMPEILGGGDRWNIQRTGGDNNELRTGMDLSLIHICRCRRSTLCRSRWSPYH